MHWTYCAKVITTDRNINNIFHRALEKKHGEVQGRADRAQKQHDVLAGTLDDIKAEVDKYLLWLTEKEQQMAEEAPLGYNVKDAETRLQEHNVRGVCGFS